MRRHVDRLFRISVALMVLVLPVQAESGVGGVYYRQGEVTFDTPIPLPGDDVRAPLSIETTGATSLSYGDPLSIRFSSKGGTAKNWTMTYTGARPSGVAIVESGQDVSITAQSMGSGPDLTFSVSLTDGTETVSASVVVKVAAPATALSLETTGSTTLAYGAPLGLKFAAKGGKTSAWRLTYAGSRPSGVTIAENTSDTTITAPALPDGTYGPFTVTLTDGIQSVSKSLTATVGTASPALSLVSASGSTASVAPGAAWNYAFDVAGGKAPYAMETSPALTGPLADVKVTTTTTKTTLSGSAPLGTYPMTVKATDAAGKVVTSTIVVAVENPKVASSTRPSAVINPSGGQVNLYRRHAEQPDWNLLYDGSTSSMIYSTGTAQSQAAGVSFDAPVTFNNLYYYGASNAGTVWVRQTDGNWVNAGTIATTNGVVTLGKSYTATAVAVGVGSWVYEVRVGNAPSTVALPTLASGVATSIGPSQPVVATSSSFTTANPYQTGISLAETPTNQNGVVLSVSSSEVRITSRASTSQDVFVVAKDDSGMKSYHRFLVQASAGGVASYPRPTSSINPSGGQVNLYRRHAEQPDWNLLYDGFTSSMIYSTGTAQSQAAGVSFDAPVTFNNLYYYGASNAGTVWVRQTDGNWVNAGTIATTNGVVTLDKPYTATAVAVGVGSWVYEVRVGNGSGTTALPTLVSGVATTIAASQPVAATSSSFTTANPYQTGISLVETPSNQNGVSLSVTDGEVRVVTRASTSQDVFVVAKDDSGMKSYHRFLVQASAGGAASYPQPSGVINPSGGQANLYRRYTGQPDGNILSDGSTSSMIYSTGTAQSQAAGVSFDAPVTFNNLYYYGASNAGTVWVRQTDGNWVNAGTIATTNGVVTLDKPYTATAVAVGVGSWVYEVRVGNTASITTP